MSPLKTKALFSIVDRARKTLEAHSGTDGRVASTEAKRAAKTWGDDFEVVDLLFEAARSHAGAKTAPLSALTKVAREKKDFIAHVAKNETLSLAEERKLDAFGKAVAEAARAPDPTQALAAKAKKWAEGRSFSSAATKKLRVPRGEVTVAAGVPSAVVKAHQLYLSKWEERDLGSAAVYRTKDFYAVHTTTDGDDGFLELYDLAGKPLASGKTDVRTGASGKLERFVAWDAKFADVRKALTPPGANTSAAVKARFEKAFKRETGAEIIPALTSARKSGSKYEVEMNLGGTTAKASLLADDTLSDVRILKLQPPLAPDVTARLEQALRTRAGWSQAKVVAAEQRGNNLTTDWHWYVAFENQGKRLTAKVTYEKEQLVKVEPTRMTDPVAVYGVAAQLVQLHGLKMASEASDLAQLEVLARTFNLGWRPDRFELGNAEESPVGFDPSKDDAQPFVYSVWGDNAVFVTFSKDGTYRVDDFN